MFDTHVNLHAEAFADDLEDTLARARTAGVRCFLAICDRLDHFSAVHAIARSHQDIWCSAGVHPHHAKDFPGLDIATLVERAALPEVVAIGETGLDFHYNHSPQAEQERSLRVHLGAAGETGLPVILHTREADERVMEILSDAFRRAPFVPLLHCYTGGAALASLALELGGYVSVSGILSFKNAHAVRDVIRAVPLERVIVETDCPYLAPVPYRGRRNEPAYLAHVCTALGALHDMEVDEIARQTEANALRLFSKVAA